MWIQLNLAGKAFEQKWDSMSDLSVSNNHKIGISSPLFKKVEMSDIEKYKARLGT